MVLVDLACVKHTLASGMVTSTVDQLWERVGLLCSLFHAEVFAEQQHVTIYPTRYRYN